MTVAKAKGLHAKLAEVMAEAGRIPKNGRAPASMGGFEFVQVGDAADAIRAALGSRGVSMLPTQVEIMSESEHETRSGGTMTTQTVRTTWTLVDGDSGESAQIQSLGTGADAGDKFSPKAQTNAMKYALLMGFLLSTGDDPERTDTTDRGAKSAEETVELLGNIQKTGTLQKGSAALYDGLWRDTPDGGHAVGVRLKLEGDDRDIPQVAIVGTIGQALYAALGEEPVLGLKATLRGKLYGVHVKGRSTYYRLVVGEYPTSDFISTADFRIPAPDAGEPVVAETTPMFDADEDAAIADALGVTKP